MELNFSSAFGVTSSVPGPAILIATQKNSIIIPISQVGPSGKSKHLAKSQVELDPKLLLLRRNPPGAQQFHLRESIPKV